MGTGSHFTRLTIQLIHIIGEFHEHDVSWAAQAQAGTSTKKWVTAKRLGHVYFALSISKG
jgi:hypothetical protein